MAPSIPKENFTCLTRLDQNRAQAQVSNKWTHTYCNRCMVMHTYSYRLQLKWVWPLIQFIMSLFGETTLPLNFQMLHMGLLILLMDVGQFMSLSIMMHGSMEILLQ